jgi:Flp pilus assembly protein TadD
MSEDDFIPMIDAKGQEVKIPRRKWIEEFLPEGLRKAWDDPEMLYALLVAAVDEKAGAAVMYGIRRLAEIDADPQRPAVLEGIALMQTGQTDQAEQVFRSFVERHGATASILTNLARIEQQRGNQTQAEATLRQALELDANLEGCLAWHIALQRQRGGDEAATAALQSLAEQPKNWRARLWIAQRRLKENQIEAALELYRGILTEGHAGGEALVLITDDLKRVGRAKELIELAMPIYDVRKHGPIAGMNLLGALGAAGQFDQAARLLQTLRDLNMPVLNGMLEEFAKRLAQASAAARPQPTPAPAGPQRITALPMLHPLWIAGIRRPDALLPPRKPDAVKVALFSLADQTRSNPDAQSETDLTRLARSLPIFLAEALRLRSDAASMCVVPVMPGTGPAIVGTPWPLPHMLSNCPPEFVPDYVVCGALTRGTRGAKIELHVFRVRDKEPLRTLRVPAGNDFSGAAAAAERDLLACLSAVGVQAIDGSWTAPQSADAYVACLGNLFLQTLAAKGVIDKSKLTNEPEVLASYVRLVEAEPQSPLPLLVAAAGVAAARRYGSPLAGEYQGKVRELARQIQDQALAAAMAELLGD